MWITPLVFVVFVKPPASTTILLPRLFKGFALVGPAFVLIGPASVQLMRLRRISKNVSVAAPVMIVLHVRYRQHIFTRNVGMFYFFKIAGDQHAELCEWCCEVIGLPQEEIGTHAARDLQPKLSAVLFCNVWH